MNIDPDQINLFMNWLPKSTKEDLLNPSAKAIGKGLGSLFDLIFYYPNRCRIYANGKLKAYATKVASDVSNIPAKYRDTSKLDTSYKIMSNSKYCINNKVLRSYFAKLLASSVDSRVNGMVSNYFPTVLSNMDTGSAAFLEKFEDQSEFPIGNLQVHGDTKYSVRTVWNDIIDWDWQHPSNVFEFMSNERSINLLSSFNIIHVDYRHWLSGPKADRAYDTIKRSLSVKGKIKVGHQLKDIKIQKGIIGLTPLGKEFAKVVIP